MAVKHVEVEGVGQVLLYKRRGSKTISLRFIDEQLRVTLPTWLPYKAALAFVHQKNDWIQKHRPLPRATINHGSRIGKYHVVSFERGDKIHAQLKLTEIVINYPETHSPLHTQVQDKAHSASLRALRVQANQLLPKRLEALSKQHNLPYTSVQCRILKSRWGSCDQRNRIVLSIYLVQLPWELIDYVLLHELTHTVHHNHGKNFWTTLQAMLADAKKHRTQLKQHQPRLVIN